MFSNKSKVLEARVDDIEKSLREIGSADAELEKRLRHIEDYVGRERQVVNAQVHDLSEKIELLRNSEALALGLQKDLQSVKDAIATLAQECSMCASDSRVEDIHQEMEALRRNVAFVCHAVEDQQREVARREQVAEMNVEIERLRDALSGDGTKLRTFMDEEAMRQNSLRIEDSSAEWLVRDLEAWIQTIPKGKYIESPAFALDVPGIGRYDDIRLRFFPNGGPNVFFEGNCSLYLIHPAAVPWAQYELMVGRSRRGTFDPIYSGADDFCALAPEVFEVDGAKAVRLSVHFLRPSPKQQRHAIQSTARDSASSWNSAARSGRASPALSSASSARSKGQAPQVADLWQASNRLDA